MVTAPHGATYSVGATDPSYQIRNFQLCFLEQTLLSTPNPHKQTQSYQREVLKNLQNEVQMMISNK